MSEKDSWFRRFDRWPFFRGNLFDIDETFRQIQETMAKEFEELTKHTSEELIRERTLSDGTKVKTFGPYVYGYSMTVGPDGKPKVREFGNIKPGTRMGKPYVELEEKREPLADVIDNDGKVRVLVELPGVEKKDIKLSGTEEKLTISVETPQRKYYKEVELPAKVEIKKATSAYKNGVLDITLLKKKEEKKSKGEPIKIE